MGATRTRCARTSTVCRTAPRVSPSGAHSSPSDARRALPPVVNSIEDWCIFAPPKPGADSVIGNTERIEVAWCTQSGHGTRVIPDGAISGAHFVQTPDYVQVTGVGDLTKINIPKGDEGGELDPHGADGNGECGVLLALFSPGRARDLVLCDVAARLRVLLKLNSYLTACRQPDRRARLLERVRRAPADARMDGKRPHSPPCIRPCSPPTPPAWLGAELRGVRRVLHPRVQGRPERAAALPARLRRPRLRVEHARRLLRGRVRPVPRRHRRGACPFLPSILRWRSLRDLRC